MLTLDQARLLMDPPLSLWEIIMATQTEVDGKRELRKVNGVIGPKQSKTFILSSDLLEFARKRGLKLKLDNA